MIIDCNDVGSCGVSVISLGFSAVTRVKNSVAESANRVKVFSELKNPIVARSCAVNIFHIEFTIKIRIAAPVGNIQNPTVFFGHVGIHQTDVTITYGKESSSRELSVEITSKEPSEIGNVNVNHTHHTVSW